MAGAADERDDLRMRIAALEADAAAAGMGGARTCNWERLAVLLFQIATPIALDHHAAISILA